MGTIAYFLALLWATRSNYQKRSESNSNSATEETSNHQCIVPERIEVSFPHEDKEEERAYRKQQYALQKSIKRATWFTFWAVLIYAGITLAIFNVNRKAAEAATNSLTEIKLQTAAQQSQLALARQLFDFEHGHRLGVGIAMWHLWAPQRSDTVAVLEIKPIGKHPMRDISGSVILELRPSIPVKPPIFSNTCKEST